MNAARVSGSHLSGPTLMAWRGSRPGVDHLRQHGSVKKASPIAEFVTTKVSTAASNPRPVAAQAATATATSARASANRAQAAKVARRARAPAGARVRSGSTWSP